MTKDDDIRLATDLFAKLITELNFTEKLENIIITPGNHDIHYDPLNIKNEKSTNGCKIINKQVENNNHWYSKFLSDLGLNCLNYYNINNFDNINILNINSTRGCCAYDTQPKFCIGCNELFDILNNPTFNDKSKINIFITHYPPDDCSTSLKHIYKKNFEKSPFHILKEKFNLFLHGHNHTFGGEDENFIRYVGGDSFSSDTVSYALYEIDNDNKSIIINSLNFNNDDFSYSRNENLYLYNTEITNKDIFKQIIINSRIEFKRIVPKEMFTNVDVILNNNILYYNDNIYNFQRVFDLYEPAIKFNSGKLSIDYINNEIKYLSIFDKIDYIIRKTKIFLPDCNFPLIIKGAKGVGKTTFLSILNIYLLHKLKKSYDYIPIIVDLKTFKDSKAAKDYITSIRKYFDGLLVFFVDGIDDKLIYKNYIDIAKFFEEFQNTYVIYCVDSHKESIRVNSNYENRKNAGIILYVNTINLYDVDNENNKALAFIKAYFNILEKKDEPEKLLKIYKELGLLEIDLNLITSFNNLTEKRYDNINLETIYNSYCNQLSINLDLESMKLAYKYIYKTDSFNIEDDDSHNFKAIIKNLRIVDYLLAQYLIDSFDKNNYNVISTLYPRNITRFIPSLIKDMDDFFCKIKKILNNKKSSSIEIKIQCCYLLGRLKKIDKTEVINILKDELENTKKLLNDSNDSKELIYAYYRTVKIALNYHSTNESNLIELIDDMIKNPFFAEINRKFQLDYYGDTKLYKVFKEFDDHYKENITGRPSINDCYKCYFALEHRIKRYMKNDIFNTHIILDLFTITNLMQIRLQNKIIEQMDLNEFEQKTLSKYLPLIKNATEKYYDRFSLIQKMYFDSMIFDFEYLFYKHDPTDYKKRPIISYKKFNLSEKLSIQTRTGWIKMLIHEDKNHLESIAEHIFSMYNIAFFYLPSVINGKPEYNKNDLLQFIMIHDFMRSLIGDIIPPYALDNEKEELESQEKLELDKKLLIDLIISGTYWDEINFVSLYKMLDDSNINYKILKDLNKLQFISKLCIYYTKGAVTNETFIEKIKEKEYIKTEEVKKIFNTVIKHNELFTDVINKFKINEF